MIDRELNEAVVAHLNRDWRDYDIDTTVQRGIQRVMEQRVGRFVTAADFGRHFPELAPMEDFGTLDLHDSDAVIDTLDRYLCAVEGLPPAFWRRCGLQLHNHVAVLHSGTRDHSAELGLVTDTDTDWWFIFLNTNAGDNGYGPPAPATIEARRAAIVFHISDDGFLSNPSRVTTSLRGTDLDWLRETGAELRLSVEPTDGSLRHL